MDENGFYRYFEYGYGFNQKLLYCVTVLYFKIIDFQILKLFTQNPEWLPRTSPGCWSATVLSPTM